MSDLRRWLNEIYAVEELERCFLGAEHPPLQELNSLCLAADMWDFISRYVRT